MKEQALYSHLLDLAKRHGYWSKEVQDFNSTLPYHMVNKINSKVIATLKYN